MERSAMRDRRSRISLTPHSASKTRVNALRAGYFLPLLHPPQLVRLRLAAVPALQRRAELGRAVADVEAEIGWPRGFDELALALELPGLPGAVAARRKLDQIARLSAVGIDAEAADPEPRARLIVAEHLGRQIVAVLHLQMLLGCERAAWHLDAMAAALRRNL